MEDGYFEWNLFHHGKICKLEYVILMFFRIAFYFLSKCINKYLHLTELQGLGLAVLGPTLLDLTDILQTQLSSISFLFALRSIGGILGSLSGKTKTIIRRDIIF